VDTLIIPDILFATASARPLPAFYPLLDRFCEGIKDSQIDSLVIRGHTDSKGDSLYNLRLSDDRAFSVQDYMLAKTGLNPAKLITHGFGCVLPVASNDTPEGRQKNRRVEIYLYLRQ
jgi:outer membrane protein OmpA-like peptidoglycan-associated protein